MASRSGTLHASAPMDSGTITAIVAGAVAIVTAFVTGLWQYMSGRKKTEADTQVTAVSGFISLVTHLQAQLTTSQARIDWQDRRIAHLERLLIRNNIEVPNDDDHGQHSIHA